MNAPGFRDTQYRFSAHIRDPDRHAAPEGVKPQRMAMYRELFFNNINNFVATSFPVIRQVLDEAQWLALVQDFFARHRSKTPYFADFAEEFLRFLQDERNHPEDPPFLLELAHYEWVELALELAEGEAPAFSQALQDNPLDCHLRLSEVAWPLAYRFPVQRISRDDQPTEPPAEPTLLAVYRDREDAVHFLELSPPAYRLLQLLEGQGPARARDCLSQIALELGHAEPAAVLAFGAQMLKDLGARSVIGVA